ncbi:MAG: valine--tRNA ligase [Patescibacteria group bacterium]|nr:valine--tRNA ligase [Patescibacteria group bacterium]MCL5093701.1 valine--tRNA ligase [Patescibacteria group bacterium]
MNEKPKTYDFKEREEHWRKFWEEKDVYRFDEDSKKPIYSVDTPPPYVSAEHLHTGHIMSYSQAEFIVRFKRMQGFNVYYPMGFDDNGLPTERFVEQKYEIDKSKITRKEFVELCLKETKLGSQNYRDLWRSLGISVDWSKTYSTINKLSQKIAQWSFLDLYKKGKIYKTKMPTLWCVHCQTAIAQADLEAEERKSKLNYIEVEVENGEKLTFATTRPELLPACMGISVHPDDKRYKRLIGKKAKLPLIGREVLIFGDETVDPKFGTGAAYFCSYGGAEDIEWLHRHPEVESFHILGPNGRFNELGGKYAGLKVSEAREKILADLKTSGALVKQEEIENVTYVHERCGTDVEYISTEQWFIKIVEAKDEFLKRGKELNWFPKKMYRIYEDWVKSLKWDWCISRQRYYGVPFPVWYCADCREIILPDKNDLPVDPTADKPKKGCLKCKSSKIKPETDVFDTWMTSSLTPLIGLRLVKEDLWEKLYPENLRPQAFEIIRTWLFYTVVKSYYHFKGLPFKDVMISGHGLDEKGRKISKRLGNYIIPDRIIEQFGADALRYWATGAKLGGNMRWNEDEVKKGKRTVTKLWNAARFVFDTVGSAIPATVPALEEADLWLLHNLNKTVHEATAYFEAYEYSLARNEIDDFFWKIFTDYYIEFVKHRVYGEDKKSKEVAAYTLYNAILTLVKLYAPIMPFITEEIYQEFFKERSKTESIHLSNWPETVKEWHYPEKKHREFQKVLSVIDAVRAYKTQNGISLGKEIEGFTTNKKLTSEEKEFIQKTQRVKRITCAK